MDYSKYTLSLNKAREEMDKYDNMTDAEFNDQIHHWAMFDVSENNYDDSFKAIREAVVSEFKNTLNNNGNKISYAIDLTVGIKLYEQLNPQNGFDIIAANDDDIWRYISVQVMPDLTFIRYPNQPEYVETIREDIPGISYAGGVKKPEKDSIRINKKRFYSHTRRIWVKTLWWYIHLGWQGDPEQTYFVLQNNGTNIISHFIERPGRGYRESLFRCMLYAYSCLPEQKDSTFRAAAKLNLAKCVSVEPALTEGGEKEYSEKLFEEVYKEGGNNTNVEEHDIG